MSRLRGFSGQLFDNMLIGSGAVVLDPIAEDFDTLKAAAQGDASKGELLGGTSGGITFSTDVDTINLGDDVDGLPVQLRGAIVLDTEAASIETNVIELKPGRIKTLNPRLDKIDIFSDAVKASTTRGTLNGQHTLEADVPGTDGNSIRYQIIVSGNNTPLSVTVDYSPPTTDDIIVRAATDGAGAVTSTANEVIAAINAHAGAASLVTAKLPTGSDGTGLVAASAMAALTGGVDGSTLSGQRYDPRGFFKDEDYLERVALLIESRNKMIRLAIILYNCLVTGGFSIETNDDQSPISVPLALTAMGDDTRRDADTGTYRPPYRLYDYSVGLTV